MLPYVDDIVLMARDEIDIQELLRITNEYGKEWKMKFSVRKCKTMEFTIMLTVSGSSGLLGNIVIDVSGEIDILGVELQQRKSRRETNENG